MTPNTRDPRTTAAARRAIACCAACWVACAPMARAAPVVGVRIDLVHVQTDVTELLSTGQTVVSETAANAGVFSGPKQTAELLRFLPPGGNASDRGPGNNIAFASALAETDGNGGVGIANVILGVPLGSNPPALEVLVSKATWTQTLGNIGSDPISMELHLAIPAIELGLFGVPPFVTSINNTEDAEATATLSVQINHLDGTTTSALVFNYGLRIQESQIPRGPNDFINVIKPIAFGQAADLALQVGLNASGVTTIGLAAFADDVDLGILQAGESLTYNYVLQVSGSTKGFERGYHAFIGDPFGVDLVGGNLTPNFTLLTASVAEPGSLPLILSACLPLLLQRLRRGRGPNGTMAWSGPTAA